MMRKLLLLATFFTGAPLLLITSMLFYLFLAYQNAPRTSGVLGINTQKKVAYAALPTNQNTFASDVVPEESRVEAVRQFLAKYNSPLEPHAHYIVEIADRYGLDHRLIPAIAMQETNLCKKAKEGSHNCWGWGVYGGKYTFFNSYPEAIESISRQLSVKYKDKHGLTTPEEIQKLYNPSNTSNWSYAVNHFMEKMQ